MVSIFDISEFARIHYVYNWFILLFGSALTYTCVSSMVFRKCSINGVKYGSGITEIGKASWKLKGQSIPQAMNGWMDGWMNGWIAL